MTVQELEGYHGQVLQQLRKSKAKIGSIIRLTSKSGEVFEGTLIPRSEYSDPTHLVLKMKNGYNIGISLDRTQKLEVIGEGEKPHFTKPSPPASHAGLPKVSIISTGGTIASKVDHPTGAVPPAHTAADMATIGVAMHRDLSDHIIVAHRGTRVRKCHTSRRDAFKSINSDHLASYNLKTGQIELANEAAKRDRSRKLVLKPRFDQHAYLIKFYPGMNPGIIDSA